MSDLVNSTVLLAALFEAVEAADVVLDKAGADGVEYAEALDAVMQAVDTFLDWMREHPDDKPDQWSSGRDNPDSV
jgi:hypothetical protein